MRRFFSSLIVIFFFLPTPSQAGFGVDYDSSQNRTSRLPALEAASQQEPMCMPTSGLSRSDIVIQYQDILAKKFQKIPVDQVKTCEFGGDQIAIQRYNGILATRVNGQNRLVYDPTKTNTRDSVIIDMSTWSPPNCPGGTIEWVMEEILERLFACYPEPGFSVTTDEEDAAHREAYEKAKAAETEALENAYSGRTPAGPGL